MRAFDWLIRTAMLAMAGLATLAILGSIAAMSGAGGGPELAGRGGRPLVEAVAERKEAAQVPAGDSAERSETGPRAGAAGGTAAALPVEPERWLEAIAYALLAVAGLLALGLLLLLQIVRELRRIGDVSRR